jgi:hypothetical protein
MEAMCAEAAAAFVSPGTSRNPERKPLGFCGFSAYIGLAA